MADAKLRITIETDNAEAEVKSLERALKNYIKTQKRSETQGKKQKKVTEELTQGWRSLRGDLLKFVGGSGIAYALISSFRSSTQAALEFSGAMAEVNTLLPDTDNLEAVSDEVRRLSTEFGAAPVEQAKALYQVISAGARNAAEASKILEVANRLAVGGVTDVATAADGLTSLLNAYGMSASEATNVSDAMFVGMKAGKTTIAELSASLGRVAPLASTAGVSLDELVAATAALTKSGIDTREAMTGLRAILGAVAKPSAEAQKQSAALGLEFNSAALEAKGLAGFMDDVVAATGGTTESMAKLFGGVESLVPALSLAGQAGEDLDEILGSMAEKSGATGEAFQDVAESDAYRLQVAMAELKDLSIELGQGILTVLVPAMEALVDVIDALDFTGINSEIEAMTDNINSLSAAADQGGAEGLAARLAADSVALLEAQEALAKAREEIERASGPGGRGLLAAAMKADEAQRDVDKLTERIALTKRAILDVGNLAELREGLKESEDVAGNVADSFGDITVEIDRLNASLAETLASLDQMQLDLQIDAAAGGLSGGMTQSVRTTPVLSGLDEVSSRLDDVADSSGNLLDELDPVLQGFASVADAFGVMDAEARGALRGISDLISGLQNIKTGGSLSVGGLMSIVGGVSALIQSVMSLGAGSEQQQREANRLRQEQIEKQQEATEDFRKAVVEFAAAVSGTPASLTAQYESLVEQFEATRRTQPLGGGEPQSLVDLREGLAANIELVTDRYREELEIRELLATGQEEAAAAMRLEVDQRRELEEAIAAGWDELTLDMLRGVHDLEKAAREMAEEARQAAEDARIERVNTDFAQSLRDRRSLLGLEGDALAIQQRQIQNQRELNAAIDAGITEDLILQLQILQAEEFAAFIESLKEVEENTGLSTQELERLAESMERYRANLIEDIRVRELYVAGFENEAQLLQLRLRQQKEYAEAVENEASGDTLQRLKDLQDAEYERLESQLNQIDVAQEYTHAVQAQEKAVKDTTRAVQETTRVLNAPSGLRLSLLQWRASAAGSPGFQMPSTSTSGSTINMGGITIQAAKGVSGKELLQGIIVEAQRAYRASGVNPLDISPELN